MSASIYLGADPEFVIVDGKGKTRPASEFTFHPKNAYEPVTAFRDGYNVEVNPAANSCRESLEVSFNSTIRDAVNRLPVGFKLAARAAYPVSSSVLKTAPLDIKEFGCDPDFDAYTGASKKPNINGEKHLKRYAGGHMHFSTTTTTPKHYEDLGRVMPADQRNAYDALVDPEGQKTYIKICDLLVGLPCTFLYNDADQFLRRKYYGQAGSYRPQTYPNGWKGVEYRVPPPQLFNHPAVLSLMYGVAREVAQKFSDYKKKWDPAIEKPLTEAINTGKGIEGLIQTVPGWYDIATLRALKKIPEIHEFQFNRGNGTWGWVYYSQRQWGLPVPIRK